MRIGFSVSLRQAEAIRDQLASTTQVLQTIQKRQARRRLEERTQNIAETIRMLESLHYDLKQKIENARTHLTLNAILDGESS